MIIFEENKTEITRNGLTILEINNIPEYQDIYHFYLYDFAKVQINFYCFHKWKCSFWFDRQNLQDRTITYIHLPTMFLYIKKYK